jgi:hypothetical protein
VQKEGLHLVDASRRHEDEVEDGEDTELEIEGAITNLPKGKTAEESGKNVQVDLVPNVVLDAIALVSPLQTPSGQSRLDSQVTATAVSSTGTEPS